MFITEDRKVVIKTITEEEKEILREILPDYYTHMKTNPRSLISKIFGCFTIQFYKPHPQPHDPKFRVPISAPFHVIIM